MFNELSSFFSYFRLLICNMTFEYCHDGGTGDSTKQPQGLEEEPLIDLKSGLANYTLGATSSPPSVPQSPELRRDFTSLNG